MSAEEYNSDEDMDCSDSDCGDTGYEDYYSVQAWGGNGDNDADCDMSQRDPEYAIYDCLRVEDVERLLNEYVEALTTSLKIKPSLAKLLLHAHEWAVQDIISKYHSNASSIMLDSRICISQSIEPDNKTKLPRENYCLVCFVKYPIEKCSALSCGHSFCNDCWCIHFEIQLLQGVSTGKEKSKLYILNNHCPLLMNHFKNFNKGVYLK